MNQQNTVATFVAETRIELASTDYEPVGVPFPYSAIIAALMERQDTVVSKNIK